MLHEYDVLVASHEADVILYVFKKGAPQRSNRYIAQGDVIAC